MKVLDLRCLNHHAFEGWFASEGDYQSQVEGGLLECPMCGDKTIARLPSAPRINIGGRGRNLDDLPASTVPACKAPASAPAPAASVAAAGSAPSVAAKAAVLQTLWLQTVQQVLARTDDVGDRFAEEARRMHYGEAEERAIRGQATAEDAEALREEGIEVLALPMPVAAKGSVQ